jgi:hypothetical protein
VNAAKPWEFLGFGEMHLVFGMKPHFGVSAAKQWELIGSGEIHPVYE